MAKCLTVLGIETSCDETAASVVKLTPDGSGSTLSDVVLSQTADHAIFGGVVPEIAARAHISHLDRLVDKAMQDAGLDYPQLDGVAVASGPGLMGGLLVGMMTAKAIALAHDLPFIGVNHLEGHALTPGLTHDLKPPYLLLLVSGGHTQIVAVEAVGEYHRYGTTIDDALGEAFDKTAKLLNLGYPGGPAVEAAARNGDAERFSFPRPLKGRPGCDFSFSGLKTAVRQAAQELDRVSETDVADICASFQMAVTDSLKDRLQNAIGQFAGQHADGRGRTLVVAGGVAANRKIRDVLAGLCDSNGFNLVIPPIDLCTDNAAMIAWVGALQLARGKSDRLDLAARARWPLDPDAAPAAFAGKKA